MLSVQDCDFSFGKDGAITCLLGIARKCECKRMVKWAINRDGKSRCVECDEEYRRNDAQLQGSHTV